MKYGVRAYRERFTQRGVVEIEHDLTIRDLGIRSGIMQYGNTHSAKLDTLGDFEIRCTIHSGMRARVKVVE